MKSIFSSVLFFLITIISFGQRIQDSHYSTFGYIDKAGRVQDGSYHTLGYINSDGSVQDASYKTLGYVNADGRIQNSITNPVNVPASTETETELNVPVFSTVIGDKPTAYNDKSVVKAIPVPPL